MNKVRIGTRRSALAMYQTNTIAAMLREHHPAIDVEIIQIDTRGDKILDVPLPQIGGKGLFTQEIEDQLIGGQIDIAVHSLKDLPSALPEGLVFAGSPTRGNPTDAMISTRFASIHELPQGALVATGSVRRRAQLLAQRPDLRFSDLRGNIHTRLRKLDDQGFDAIIMATTALERLELHDRITQRLEPSSFVPAVGQGAMAIEAREDDRAVTALLKPLLDAPTMQAVVAERAFMARLEGGCSTPLAAHAHQHQDGTWSFFAWVSDVEAKQIIRGEEHGDDPLTLALEMVEDFIERGAQTLLRP